MRVAVASLVVSLCLASAAWAAPERTDAPYFEVPPPLDGQSLILAESVHDVSVSGVVASVRLTQIYVNEGGEALDAQYVFPLSTRAAVYRMTMTVGTRVIAAEVREKEAARALFAQAVAAGQTASLLEQQRPNVFTMSVGRVQPGDVVQVDIDYVELLVPTDAIYTLTLPGVVAPRYGDARDRSDEPLTTFDAPLGTWDVSARLEGGVPLQWLRSGTHRVVHTDLAEDVVEVALAEAEPLAGRDFVLQYALAGDALEAGVLRYEAPDGEKFFLALVEPPARVEAATVLPREYIFIVDVSGSMDGYPIETARALMRELLGQLGPEDRFNVLTFAGASTVLAEASVAATRANITRASELLDGDASGSTDLLPALQRALALPVVGPSHSRTVVVITDGLITCEQEAFDLVRASLGQSNLFTFGVGDHVNRHLLEGLALAGRGEPFVVTQAAAAADEAERFRDYITAPVLTRVSLVADGVELYDLEPAALPDVFASRPIVVSGKYRGARPGTLTIGGMSARGPWQRTIDLAAVAASPANVALRVLWARERIARLSDRAGRAAHEANREGVTKLGLDYHLMTAFTSFVAVDSESRAAVAIPVHDEPDPGSEFVIGSGSQGMGGGGGGMVASGGGIGLMEVGRIQGGGYGSEIDPFGASAPSVTVTLGPIAVTGTRAARDVEQQLRRRLGALRACFSAAASNGQAVVKRALKVKLTIAATGQVSSVALADQDAPAACARRALMRVRFPAGTLRGASFTLNVAP